MTRQPEFDFTSGLDRQLGGPPRRASLDSLAAGRKAKDRGMAVAAENRRDLLELARAIAVQIAHAQGEVNADDVADELARQGWDPAALGPAAGSIFAGKEWQFTGRRVLSKRVRNHARELKVWRLHDVLGE